MKVLTKEELKLKLELHLKWLKNEAGGENANLRSADLSYANLRSANLRSANLRSADLSSADLSSANLSSADLRSADLRYADLRSANLRSANLRSANLRSANLDFSAYPLWCGTKNVKLDLKIIYQLCAHICVVDNDSKEFAEIKEKLMVHALKSHRAQDLGLE